MPSKLPLAADVTTLPRRLRDPEPTWCCAMAMGMPPISTSRDRLRPRIREGQAQGSAGADHAIEDRGIDTSDQIEDNIALLALLTVGWHLVDLRGEVIDLRARRRTPPSSTASRGCICFQPVWFAANSVANFLPAGSPTSSATGNGRLQTSDDLTTAPARAST
jgi:hypothetical protein